MQELDTFEYERTTIQLVPRQMRKLDRLRRRLGISRSAMLAILIDQWPDHDERETTEE